MSFTRFHDDPDRIKKQLQQTTDIGRYMLNTPGPGDKPLYVEDPYIRPQYWAGNIMTNTVDIETELRGMTRRLNKDTPENYYLSSDASTASRTNELIVCPTRAGSAVSQSRVTHPAWMLRDVEQDNWKMLHFDPQDNVFMPFRNNLSTRILEKDHFTTKPVPSILGLGHNNHDVIDDTYLHPLNRNPVLEGMVGDRRTTERGLGVDGFGVVGRGDKCTSNTCKIEDVGDFRQFSGEALFS
jgi:hypothetical protein